MKQMVQIGYTRLGYLLGYYTRKQKIDNRPRPKEVDWVNLFLLILLIFVVILFFFS